MWYELSRHRRVWWHPFHHKKRKRRHINNPIDVLGLLYGEVAENCNHHPNQMMDHRYKSPFNREWTVPLPLRPHKQILPGLRSRLLNEDKNITTTHRQIQMLTNDIGLGEVQVQKSHEQDPCRLSEKIRSQRQHRRISCTRKPKNWCIRSVSEQGLGLFRQIPYRKPILSHSICKKKPKRQNG